MKTRTFIDVLENMGSYREQPNEPGYRNVGRGAITPQFIEAAKLYNRVLNGDRYATFLFQEALSTSDFPNLFGDILDRQVLAGYQEANYTWNMYCKRGTVRDFRVARRFRLDHGEGVLDGPIAPSGDAPGGGSGTFGIEQLSEYPARKRTDGVYNTQVFKYGARMPFSWETMINDDLDVLKDTPALFGRAARRTEEKKVTELYVSSTGPNATFFSVANKNILSTAVSSLVSVTNAPLSITALQQAMVVMALQRDLDGEPISNAGAILVVPRALEVTAMNILNASQVWMNDQGGTVDGSGNSLQRLLADNWARKVVKLAVNVYLDVVDTTHGNTAWYLIADPNSGRPALEMDFLRGHEQPELFMKSPNAVRVGGGAVDPMEGDFDTDSIDYKVRYCMGGTTLDPKRAVASNGSGS